MKKYLEIREKLMESIRKELIGPHIDDDGKIIIKEYPYNRYFTGILAPQQDYIEESENEELGVEGEDEEEVKNQSEKNSTNKFKKQSTMGLTFVIEKNELKNLNLNFSGIIYTKTIENEMEENEEYRGMAFDILFDLDGIKPKNKSDFKLKIKNINIDSESIKNFEDNFEHIDIEKMISGFMMVRVNESGDLFMITFSVSNILEKKKTNIEDYIFSSKIKVDNKLLGKRFLDRKNWVKGLISKQNYNVEKMSNEFLNRNIPEYAVGHGVAVTWRYEDGNQHLETNFIPSNEIRPIVPRTLEDDSIIEMEHLSKIENVYDLETFIEGYQDWIEDLKIKQSELDEEYEEISKLHLRKIEKVRSRIIETINLLNDNNNAFVSFKLMNEAMYIMRKYSMIKDNRPSWRPFQLAFILFSLGGIIDEDSDSRKEVDLLWFPTGGGKTEAYLGLMAFTLIFRRLIDPNYGAGTGVISRYTLRLLTLQQFQRTTSLICALNILRKEKKKLGEIPFSIGLWVGGDTTPNYFKDAKKSLESPDTTTYSIKQFQICPWCGYVLDGLSYKQFYKNDMDAKIKCNNDECEFKDGIQCYLTDEQIYEIKPSILMGTIDKFARIPKLENVKHLFNSKFHKSPDMIVQDELHLINGPIGSIYGLYEMMIEGIIADLNFNRLPKLITSSATVTNATNHIKTIYARDAMIFPPMGFNYGDSYWAIPDIDSKPGRIYMGIHPQGKSPTNALKAIIAQQLAKTKNLLKEYDEKDLDPYWTLVGYFSSLRELGAAMMLVSDVIPDRIKQLADMEEYENEREKLNSIELTSRLKAEEISMLLEDLNNKLTEKDKKTIDSIFATNMISVGVDVSRLSSMVVAGQPKSTAEYIQATSRVGRTYPGLVIVQYNWTRPRDRSHYEKFIYYHNTINSFVDPLTATPFSKRAIERALHASIIGIVRHVFRDLVKEKDAGNLCKEELDEEISNLKNFILEWVSNANINSYKLVEEEISNIFNDWRMLCAKHGSKLNYTVKVQRTFEDNNIPALMVSMDGSDEFDNFPKRTLDSMRSVENVVNYKVVRYSDRRG